MTQLYLVTGFLGAGKTTFLRSFAAAFPDKKIALVINEFGAAGVDGALLQDMRLALTEINNGSIFCACRLEQFETAVRDILHAGPPDLIFVEASGLSDPAAVRGIFRPGAFPQLDYAGAICLVDAARFHKVYQTARVCRMQLAVSDMVLLNKADLATRRQLDDITAMALAQKPDRPVHETTYGGFDPAWLAQLRQIPADDGPVQGHLRDINLQTLTLTVFGFDKSTLTAFLQMFAGDTYRIKGFVALAEGTYLVDCVGPLVQLRPFAGQPSAPGQLVVLFGHGLPARKSIREALPHFPGCQIALA